MSERQPIDLDDLQRVGVLVREKTADNWLADMVQIACDEIARLREERRSISTLLGKVETLEADNARLREERRRREEVWLACAEETRLVYGGVFMPKPLPPGPEPKEPNRE